jgi:hypothetical protein
MSVVVSYNRQLLFALIFVFILLLAIEGTLRTFEWIYPGCVMVDSESQQFVDIFKLRQMCLDVQQLNFQQFDGYKLYEPDQHFSTVNINSEGFRGEEFFSQKDNSTYRVFLIGGSTAFGSGATSDDTTIPGSLQKQFEEINPELNVEIINAGVPAANSNTENKLIFDKIIGYDPDLLIFYDGWNDAWHRNLILSEIDSSHTDKTITSSKVNSGIIDFFQNKLKIYKTPLILYKHFFWGKTTHYQGDINTEDFLKISEKISLNWKEKKSEICTLGENKSFKTIVILQPILDTGNKPYSKSEKELLPKTQFDIETVDLLNKLEKPLSELNDICDQVIDLRNAFDDVSNPIYFDFGHMNDYGNEIIAEKIYENILPIVLEDISK